MKAIGLHEYLPIEEENSLIDMEVENLLLQEEIYSLKLTLFPLIQLIQKFALRKIKRRSSENTWLGCEWCCCTNRRKLYVI